MKNNQQEWQKKQIEIMFHPEKKESTFGLPYRIEVEKGTTIEWVIEDPIVYKNIFLRYPKFRKGAKFTLYFEKTTPFQWKSESLRLVMNYPFIISDKFPIIIASGKAENSGDHKYGLKLVSLDNEDKYESDYDDDPYLKVF